MASIVDKPKTSNKGDLLVIKSYTIVVLLITSLNADSCWKIQNKDQKALCESQNEGKKSCCKIKNKDLRAYCEVSAYGKKSCWKIKNKDMRAMCEAQY
jgi:hypothetical protein